MVSFGTPSYGDGTAAPLVIAKPTDLVDNCIVIIAARSQDASGSTAWTPPPGFALVTATPVLPSSSYRVGGIWWKKIGLASAEPATYTLTGPTGRTAGIAVKYIPDVTGTATVVGTTPYGGSSVASGIVNFGARTNSDSPAVTFLALGNESTAGISMTPTTLPSGFTAIGNTQTGGAGAGTTGSRTAIWLGYRVESTTSVAAVTGGWSGSTGGPAGYAGSLKGGLTAAPVPMGIPVKLGDGATAYLSYIDGAGVRKAPASIRVTKPAFVVADMLDSPGVTMGHRGASAVTGMPEMSRKAYKYAAYQRNYRMLEFSCGRTSDGVFFGLHDQTLARTSENAALTTNVSAMTWAQVQAYQNSLNSSGSPVAYYRLEDFLDEFTQESTIHVDPKYAIGGANNAAFLAVLAAHGGAGKIVVKYVGTGSGATGLADAARGAGFLTAGYFYEADWAAGLIDAEQSHWDILGMEYTASANAWSRTTSGAYPGLRSYGKPVLAHIIPDQAGYNTAQTKISEGGWLNGSPGRTWIAQVSGVNNVAPVS